MGFWVYILECADGSFFTGHTEDLEIRLAQHASRKTLGYTASRLPVSLIFSQEYPTREEAIASERQIKGWSRKKKEAMIRGDWDEVARLAKGKTKGSEPCPSTSSGRTVEK
jgi:predicted GIY-YIG superfamily endonuclease